MTFDDVGIDIVDIAYQIIDMHKENQRLKEDLKHYKKMHEMNCNATTESIESNKKFLGIMLDAALDPDSVINKGHEAILKEKS